MNIAFYISNHGFGHIMRNLPVIAHLLKHTENRVILVTAHKQMEIAGQYLEQEGALSGHEGFSEFIRVEQDVDVGLIVRAGTLSVDTNATVAQLEKYAGRFPELIAGAKELFKAYSVDRVVIDIVPWALTAAKEAGVPSYLMASFTWLEQYEEFVPETLLAPFRRCFADVDKVLLYELANEPTRKRYPFGTEIGFVARLFHENKVKEIKEKYGNKPIVFLSIGGSNSGLDFTIDVSDLPYNFISTEGFQLKGENVFFLPVTIDNTQDYVAASDFCISKAGWSTISEIMLAGKPMALLERTDVPEDRMNIAELVRRKAAVSVTVEELRDIGGILKKMQEAAWDMKEYVNGCVTAAKAIVE